MVVDDPWACRIVGNWEANKRDSEMRLGRSACSFIDGGGGVVSGYHLCPVVTLVSPYVSLLWLLASNTTGFYLCFCYSLFTPPRKLQILLRAVPGKVTPDLPAGN